MPWTDLTVAFESFSFGVVTVGLIGGDLEIERTAAVALVFSFGEREGEGDDGPGIGD